MIIAQSAQYGIHFTSLGLDPVLVQLGPFAIRWYSLAYLAGILFAWWFLLHLAQQDDAAIKRSDVEKLISWATVGIIAGGRMAYVVFYEPATYLADPLSIFALWRGGMSFHGGAAGVGIATFFFCRKHGLNWLRVLDLIAMCAPIGLMLGRVANFINGELWGRPTTLPWGIIFPGGGPLARHPSQLYEALLEGPILFLSIWMVYRFSSARQRPGVLTGSFMLGYGLLRFLIEFVREPDEQLTAFAQATGLHMGQWLCVPMILGGAALIAYGFKRRHALPMQSD